MSGLNLPTSLTAPNPIDGSSAGQGDDLFRALVAALQSNLAPNLSGVFTGRPAPGVAGRTYTATDTGGYYVDTGSAWLGPFASMGTNATFARLDASVGMVVKEGTSARASMGDIGNGRAGVDLGPGGRVRIYDDNGKLRTDQAIYGYGGVYARGQDVTRPQVIQAQHDNANGNYVQDQSLGLGGFTPSGERPWDVVVRVPVSWKGFCEVVLLENDIEVDRAPVVSGGGTATSVPLIYGRPVGYGGYKYFSILARPTDRSGNSEITVLNSGGYQSRITGGER